MPLLDPTPLGGTEGARRDCFRGQPVPQIRQLPGLVLVDFKTRKIKASFEARIHVKLEALALVLVGRLIRSGNDNIASRRFAL